MPVAWCFALVKEPRDWDVNDLHDVRTLFSVFSEPTSSVVILLDLVLLPRKCCPQPVYMSMPIFLWMLSATHYSSSHLMCLKMHIEVAVGTLFNLCYDSPVGLLLWKACHPDPAGDSSPLLEATPSWSQRNASKGWGLGSNHCPVRGPLVNLTDNPSLHHVCHIHKHLHVLNTFL